MRIAFVVGAVALAGCNASDPPQHPLTSEALARRTECGELGAAWIKQHPLPEDKIPSASAITDSEDSEDSEDKNRFAARIFYGSKTNKCLLIMSDLG
jgi:hypothetical protein